MQEKSSISAASSLLSLTNLSSTHMSLEKSDESSVFSDATETDELDHGSSTGSIEQGVNEKQPHILTDLSDSAINREDKDAASAVIESHDGHNYDCQSNLDYVNLAEKVADSIIDSAQVELELERLATECVNDALAKVELDAVAFNQNDSWHEGETGPMVISPYLGTVPQGANYAATSTTRDNTTTRSSKMKDIESLAAEQVNIAIAGAQALLKEEMKPPQVHQPMTAPRRRKIDGSINEPTVELINDPTANDDTTRSDENDNAQIGFIIISLITLFLIIKLVAKLGGFLLDIINP